MTQKKVPDMHITWLKELNGEFDKPYMEKLREFLINEKSNNKVTYPPNERVFSSLKFAALDRVKLVIIGQDPYHGFGQANGLAFSVEKGVKIPPSLVNIYKEISADIGKEPPGHGDLTYLAKQGVLLLNSVLTVEEGNPASHAGKGWEDFTDQVIQLLNRREEIVFMLWGSYAQKKGSIIDTKRHKVLKAPHPSPLSAHRGFFGSKHFSQANEYLKSKGKSEILWT
jgi:uracil-DNA glycosylase